MDDLLATQGSGGLTRAGLYNQLVLDRFRDLSPAGQMEVLATLDDYANEFNSGNGRAAIGLEPGSLEARRADLAMRMAADFARQSGAIPEDVRFGADARAGMNTGMAMMIGAIIGRDRIDALGRPRTNANTEGVPGTPSGTENDAPPPIGMDPSSAGQRASAEQELAHVLHQIELGRDPGHNGQFRLDEAITGARIEREFGVRLRRDPSGDNDWFMPNGTSLDAASPPPERFFNEVAFNEWKGSMQRHINKDGLNIIVVDPVQRGLNEAQIRMVNSYLDSLPPHQRSRIIVLK
ncbi:MAG: hypothetical protein QM772_05795 [Ottowia sp.]|uniref:hypothetical protein n=1 Tax=Ottowia sp. TaxID=1898956 RepID=UPI0039E5612C